MSFNINDYLVKKGQYQEFLKSLDYDTQYIRKCVEDTIEIINDTDGPLRTVIYGDPQCGKTSMMCGLTARLLDEGFKLIIILVQDNLALLEQNETRFQETTINPSPTALNDILPSYVNVRERAHIVFCTKNTVRLKNLASKVKNIDKKIIIDDEADYASPNSKINKIKDGVQIYTSINKHIQTLLGKNGTYIGVTATPARLDLNNSFNNDTSKWITFPPHSEYTGADTFFPLAKKFDFHISWVKDEECPNTIKEVRTAVVSFLVKAAHLNITRYKKQPQNWIMLMHTSHIMEAHEEDKKVLNKILTLLSNKDEKLLEEIYKCAEKFFGIDSKMLLDKINNKEFAKHENTPKEITKYIVENCSRTTVGILNSNKGNKESISVTKYTEKPSVPFTFTLGGNIVSRGLTFNNLLSMYFTRSVKWTMQQDTFIQRARMFGTRKKYLSHFELTIPKSLYEWWWTCFYLNRFSYSSIKYNDLPVWNEGMKTNACASSSIDKKHIDMEKGEMALDKLKYTEKVGNEFAKNIYATQDFVEKIKNLNIDFGEEVIPDYILKQMLLLSDSKVGVLLEKSVDNMDEKNTDRMNILRPRGMIAGNDVKFCNTVGHFVVLVRNKKNGYFRIYYKHNSPRRRYLRNTKRDNK
jgi:hypothetical protein